jgi:GNAT superfamily N-acetyltransferase
LRHTVANLETATDFQDLRAWPAVVVETARILRQTYAATLIVPLSVLKPAAAEALTAALAEVDPDLRRFRLVAPEATLRARILHRAETEGSQTWSLERLAAGQLLMADPAFGEAVPTEDRAFEQVADSILARLLITRRAATPADLAFARRTHHLAYRDVVERQFGAWIEEHQDAFFASSWAAVPHEIILFNGEPCGHVCVEDRPSEIHLRELVLAPAYQGRGIGSAVLGAVIDHGRTRRVPVRLGTHLLNRAANLYRRMGFREIGRTDTHILFELS